MQINKLLFIMLLALTPALASAAIYKWVDEQGNVQYSAEKPVGAEAEKMSVNSRPPTDSSSYRKPGRDNSNPNNKNSDNKNSDKDNKDKTPAEKRNDQTKQAESDKIKKEMCDEARATLSTIEGSGRVRVEDGKGNINYMSEEEVTARKKSEQERVNKYCK